MNDEYTARVVAAQLEDDPTGFGEWAHEGAGWFLKDDRPRNDAAPKWWIQQRWENLELGWWVFDFASFPVSGPFPTKKAAMFAMLLMRGTE